MTVAENRKRIKREPAEIVKKLFMMGIMATQNQSWMEKPLNSSWWITVTAKQKVEVDNADIERFFSTKMVTPMKMTWLSVHQL